MGVVKMRITSTMEVIVHVALRMLLEARLSKR